MIKDRFGDFPKMSIELHPRPTGCGRAAKCREGRGRQGDTLIFRCARDDIQMTFTLRGRGGTVNTKDNLQ